MSWAEERAYAKINLGLKVLDRRPDGYHNILSVLQTVDLFDTLRFETLAAGSIEIACADPQIPSGSENLIHRAVEVLRSATGVRGGVRVTLEKRIPVGAGLGGGSSDAAATLRALNQAWSLSLSPGDLHALAGKLGSDVFFFLRPGTAIVTGRGEQIRYISWSKEVFYLLVDPGFEVSTEWAYRNLRIGLTERSAYISFISSTEGSEIDSSGLFACLENDFATLLIEAYPEVERIRSALDGYGPLATSVSGSGSTIYAAFDKAEGAMAAEAGLRELGHPVVLCRPVQVDQGTALGEQEGRIQ
ncbi:MAG: 4-(cytidine 5'-diphospho)-2-C-methyl-D-erythritol kinase [Candidatus Latescibacteria bacterium]|nr:4-(cytidine 5'-diphospho)-2-C-methyl-D-erythritol kinase [Candidatus Latescibacterota bacterium]